MIDGFIQVAVGRSRALGRWWRRPGRGWLAPRHLAVRILALTVSVHVGLQAQAPRAPTNDRERVADGQRLEGQAVLDIADDAMRQQSGMGSARQPAAPAPSGLAIRWENAFLKAQQGTFVPFTVVIESTGSRQPLPEAVLVYVRAVERTHGSNASGSAGLAVGPAALVEESRRKDPKRERPGKAERKGRGEPQDGRGAGGAAESGQADYPVDAIFPVELSPGGSRQVRVSRGFSVGPGDYDIYVVVRERVGSGCARRGSEGGRARAAAGGAGFLGHGA